MIRVQNISSNKKCVNLISLLATDIHSVSVLKSKIELICTLDNFPFSIQMLCQAMRFDELSCLICQPLFDSLLLRILEHRVASDVRFKV